MLKSGRFGRGFIAWGEVKYETSCKHLNKYDQGTDCEDVKKVGRTVSGTLGFEPCSSGRDREVASREGSHPADRWSAVHQPTYVVYCWGLRKDCHLADLLISVLEVKRSLGGENQ